LSCGWLPVAPTPRGDTKTLARAPHVSSTVSRPVVHATRLAGAASLLAVAVPSACLQVGAVRSKGCGHGLNILLISLAFDGGRDRDRTCDPYHVKVVLFR
jgi:hypothetical protein